MIRPLLGVAIFRHLCNEHYLFSFIYSADTIGLSHFLPGTGNPSVNQDVRIHGLSREIDTYVKKMAPALEQVYVAVVSDGSSDGLTSPGTPKSRGRGEATHGHKVLSALLLSRFMGKELSFSGRSQREADRRALAMD